MKQRWLVLFLLFAAQSWAAGPFELKRPPAKGSFMPWRTKFDSTHEYDVRKYTLAVYLPMYNDSLYGHQRISALKNGAVDSIGINSVRLDIDSVKLNGGATGYAVSPDTLMLWVNVSSVSPAQSFLLDIYYRGGNFSKNGSNAKGYYWYPQGYNVNTDHSTGYTMSEPQDARMWMPCFDEPWDKADSGCQISISAPDSFVAASNGLLADTVRRGDTLTWVWTENSPITTYLMCFTTSRYAAWSDYAHLESGDSIPVSYFVWPVDSGQAASYFAITPSMVECYSRLFHEYPFAKYGMAAVYPFNWGGMEHQTMTTIHRWWIYWNVQEGIAHELAHMWFGDLVTCGTWADIWLNEGFACYSEALFYEADYAYPAGRYMVEYFSDALYGEANNHPIYDPPYDLMFDWSMEYCKGAWVAHSLRWVMGDSAYFQALRVYCDSFAYGNAVTNDLQRITEQHYGSSLDWYFDEWVHRAGHPIYAGVTYYKTRGDSNSAKIRLLQTSVTGEIYKMPVALACSTEFGARDTVVWDSLPVSGLYHLSDTLPLVQVLFDRHNWILKEYADSLPALVLLETPSKQKGGPVVAHWRRFTADTLCAGYHLYRYDMISGAFQRVNPAVITDTLFADTTVAPGEQYYYCVSAVCGEDTCYETRGSNVLDCVTGVSGEAEVVSLLSDGYRLWQNRPNPFRHSTTLRYQLPAGGRVAIKVYNLLGQQVRILTDEMKRAGSYTVQWDGRDEQGQQANSGLYLVRLETGNNRQTRIITLIK